MNWFEILKMLGLNKPNVKEFARQKDEDFIFEDEDEGDCYDEFAAMTKRVMVSFPNASKLQEYKGSKGEHGEYAYDDFYIRVDYNLEEKGKSPMKFTVPQLNCLSLRKKDHLRKPVAAHTMKGKLLGTIILVALKIVIFMLL